MTTVLTAYQQRFQQFAEHQLHTDAVAVGDVYAALHYSFFAAGGKRLRPALVYAMAASLGIDLARVDYFALAVECIHTYSLIHDDLPAMDNDDLRRGQPACHKQFNEATAILAGDALNTLAFELLSRADHDLSAVQTLQQIHLLAEDAGISGMVGGQDMDLCCEHQHLNIDLAMLTELHTKKTAQLIKACLCGAYLAADHVDREKLTLLSEAAVALGIFYQIQDDILDVTQTSEILGKPGGSDIANAKTTFVSLLGLVGAQQAAKAYQTKIQTTLTTFFQPYQEYSQTPLATIIDYIIRRQH